MCRKVTTGGVVALASVLCSLAAAEARLDWRHIGNSAIDLALPSVATGPVDRVWYSADGSILYARAQSGRIFETSDLENWQAVPENSISPPSAADAISSSPPEPGAHSRAAGTRAYAFGRNVFRSDDGGVTWANVSGYKGVSILGAPVADLAISPRDNDEMVVANAMGVWHSADGGLSWAGLNFSLPNLPLRRIYALPSGVRGVMVSLALPNSPELEWTPGEKTAWRISDGADAGLEQQMKAAALHALKARITAVAAAGDTVYAGAADGRLWVSQDKGAHWSLGWDTPEAGPVEAIHVDPKEPRTAIAALGARLKPLSPGVKAVHVVRTMNAGLFWDDATSNLPDTAAYGVTADRGTVYAATAAGVFFTTTDLGSAGRPGAWSLISDGLPMAPVMDVKLDAGGNQLYAAVQGYGVYATLAPHRLRDVRVVNAADYSDRPAAPGSLLSVLGLKVTSARSGDATVPVLDASDVASQIQVPFDAKGQMLALSFDAASGRISAGFPLRSVSPAIFVDPDGTPMLLDADSGVMLDASKPAHSGTRIQVLATGMGRVDPDWPAGTPGPVADPPRVIAPVRAYLDRTPVEVSRAVLSSYVGFYLIEIQLPRIVNSGPAELYIEAEGQSSNRVRLYIEP